MQRIGLSVRGCTHRTLVCRSFDNDWRRLLPSYQGQGSTRRLSSHDDFWTSTKSEAESTPAYDYATRATSTKSEAESTPAYDYATRAAPYAAPPSGGDGTGLATPGVVGAMPQQMPAPRPPNQSDGLGMTRSKPLATFDMQSPMHLSPVRQIDVRSFRGMTLVDIRQYYRAEDGAIVPTKKGICLTLEQWKALKGAIDDVDRIIGTQESRRDTVDDGNVDVLGRRDGRF